MNIYRFLGDMCHLSAMFLLPYKLHTSRSAAGISLKMQELYLLVFVTRYLDLFFRFFSAYNSMMKITYIALKAITIGMMRYRPSLKASYDRSLDRFRPWMHGILPSLALAVVITTWNMRKQAVYFNRWSIITFLWVFSEVLEPLAVIPQLLVFRGCTDAGRLGWVYVCLMGTYRALYILNWVWRSYNELGYRHHPLVYFAGVVQTTLFVVFILDRRFRISRDLPPNASAGNDIMGSNSSARERLLADDNADQHQHQHRENGFDGEIIHGVDQTISAGDDRPPTDAQPRDEGGGHKAPRRGRWRRQKGEGGGGGDTLNKIESALLLERERGGDGGHGESFPPLAGSRDAEVAAAQGFGSSRSTAAAAAAADGAMGGDGGSAGGGVYVV